MTPNGQPKNQQKRQTGNVAPLCSLTRATLTQRMLDLLSVKWYQGGCSATNFSSDHPDNITNRSRKGIDPG